MRRLAVALAVLLPSLAGALDRFELQVYEAEANDPGQASLELHTNFTFQGARRPAFPGEIAPHHVLRTTLEPAIGVTRWLELGAYLQGMATSDGYRYAGAKLRAKLVVPHAETGWFYGLNIELARVPGAVSDQPWSNEFRPIVGWTDGTWLLDLNPIFGWELSGPERLRADLDPAFKVSWNTGRGFALGLEWYAELGRLDALQPLSRQPHYLFAVLDLAEAAGREKGPWEINLALGGGITSGADQQFLVKTILGRSF
jgi:hypothetical protein